MINIKTKFREGVFREINEAFGKIEGEWKKITEVCFKKDGEWICSPIGATISSTGNVGVTVILFEEGGEFTLSEVIEELREYISLESEKLLLYFLNNEEIHLKIDLTNLKQEFILLETDSETSPAVNIAISGGELPQKQTIFLKGGEYKEVILNSSYLDFLYISNSKVLNLTGKGEISEGITLSESKINSQGDLRLKTGELFLKEITLEAQDFNVSNNDLKIINSHLERSKISFVEGEYSTLKGNQFTSSDLYIDSKAYIMYKNLLSNTKIRFPTGEGVIHGNQGGVIEASSQAHSYNNTTSISGGSVTNDSNLAEDIK